MDFVLSSASVDFKHPFTSIVSGCTGSGKSVFVKKLLESDFIQPPPEKLIYCYGQYQPLFEEIKKHWTGNKTAMFVKGVPKNIQDIMEKETSIPKIVVIDDLMCEISKDKEVSNIFTKGSHHLNCSVILIVQNVYHQGSQMRDISLNAHYNIIFKNPRDCSQISTLSRQMFPSDNKRLIRAFQDATKKKYGYLIANCHPHADDYFKLYTDLFEPMYTVYPPDDAL